MKSTAISLMLLLAVMGSAATELRAQTAPPLRIVITEGVIEPLPFAVSISATGTEADQRMAADIARVITSDLEGTGLFRAIPQAAHIARPQGIDVPVPFADWKAIRAQALVQGSTRSVEAGIEVNFRLFDVFAESPFGQGLRYRADESSWRRVAHKIADTVYHRVTGELPFFDSQVAFISESGSKDNRMKRLMIMDYDGANPRSLTDGTAIILAPRFSPDGDLLIYTSYETGFPNVFLLDLRSGSRRSILRTADMTFAPRFSPDGSKVVLSLTRGANTDIYEVEIGGQARRLTHSAAIDTAPSYSPDGKWITFESDRSQTQQIYVLRTDYGEPRRISFGSGRYGTPVWSPTGDYIAFTKQLGGKFHIGVMRADGSEERILTSSFLDEGPTWAPNGRALMFFRESPGPTGGPSLYSVDLYGRNLKRVQTPEFGSDPAWSPLRK